MDYKILLITVQLIMITCKVRGDYCTYEDNNGCTSYTVICSNGIDSLDSNCDDAAITLVLKNFQADTFVQSVFSETDGSFDPMVQFIRGHDNVWTTLGQSLFYYYDNVITIDLSGNHIKYISDLTFEGLYLLESLNLSRNSIETLSKYSLSIGRRSKINTVDLSSNKISSISAEVFQSLTQLRSLYLDNNNIANPDNITIANIDKINHLSMHNNQLTILNNLLIHANSLTILDISQNKLTHLHGHEIFSLRYIQVFNASWNAIETIDIDCFNQAVFLVTLDLSNNKIESAIGSNMFFNNLRLEYLNMYNNSISEIQKHAFKYINLSYINLERNYLSGVIGEYAFAGIQSTKLNFSNYDIEIIKNYAFSNSSNLVYLNLNRNVINTIEDHGIEFLHSLEILDLSHNSISTINFLENCCFNLTELYLKDNKLESLPSTIFHKYMFIKIFDVSMNNIAVLAQNSLPLNNLQYFKLKGNLLHGVIENNIFDSSLYIKTLDLSNMNFTGVHSGAFNNLPSLIRLNISHNQIAVIDSNNFVGLNNLYILDLSFNQLKSLDVNNIALKNLKSIYLNNNNFISISAMVSHCESLMFLDISYNQIEDTSSAPFELSRNLHTLYLSHNKIQRFNNEHTNKLTKLVNLKLSSNKLENLNLSYFAQLESLEISNIGMKEINRTFLQNLNHLKYLDLSNNEISDLPSGTFHGISGIKYLNIASNNLVKLRFGSLHDLHAIGLLDVSNNSLSDLDAYIFHECASLKKLVIDYNRITKLDINGLVEILPNLQTISLGGNAFSCAEVIQSIKTFNHSSVYVTSLHKVYHDDNVHGINCGTDNEIATTSKTIVKVDTGVPTFHPIHNNIEHVTHPNIIHVKVSYNEYTTLKAWCSILTVFLIITLLTIGYYYYKRHYNLRTIINNFDKFYNRRVNSVEINGTGHNSNLLNS